MNSIVEVKGNYKTYGDLEALRGVDLVPAGGRAWTERLRKTTLLKMMAGLIGPTKEAVDEEGASRGPGRSLRVPALR